LVLVGISLGGLDAILFASRYRRSAAGMVLVDPSYIGMERGLAAYSAEKLKKVRKMVQKLIADPPCVNLAKAGRLNRATDKFNCLDKDYPDDPVLQAELDRQEMQPQNQAAQFSETENVMALTLTNPAQAHGTFDSQNDREMAGAQTNFGNMPLIVLSSGKNCAHDPICVASHNQMVKYSSVGRSIIVKDSEHAIEIFRPDAVVDATREVVGLVRKN
jgi:pimeloyl-ACP methyl ester carboxylesterase